MQDKSNKNSPIIIFGILFFLVLFVILVFQNIMAADERKTILKSINCLYLANIVAVDNLSGQRLDADLLCEFEKYSRYTKGAEPSIIVNLEKGEFIFAMSARYFKDGIKIKVVCDGYETQIISVDAHDGGVVSGKNRITILCKMSRNAR